MKKLTVDLNTQSYNINIGAGILCRIGDYFNLDRRVFIITDDGVPREYALKVLSASKDGFIYTVPSGEGAKSFKYFEGALSEMARLCFGRGDAVLAVGGGVVGDLAGFVASSYMRGVDFYNVPTTTLSVLDSSIGGKVAINLGDIKNIVGAFKQPKGVLIDTDTLKSLDKRQYASGLAEALKMSLTSNPSLFEFFEKNEITDANIETLIYEALKIKKSVVEEDERELSLRRILNFGHTYGHAIESVTGMKKYYHGECVALGMIPMCSDGVRQRLLPVLKKLGLPTDFTPDFEKIKSVISHDKKTKGNLVSAVFVKEIGKFEIVDMRLDDLINTIRANLSESGEF